MLPYSKEKLREDLEKQDLSRAEKRRMVKEFTKVQNAIKKLTPAQAELIEMVTNTKVQERLETINTSMDRALTAFFILENAESSWKEISKIQDRFIELLLEDIEKENEIIKGTKGDTEMAKKKMMDMEKEVRKVAEDLVNKGINQKDAVEILVGKFPKLSKSMVTNAYKKIKEELKEVKKVDSNVQAIKEKLGTPSTENEKEIIFESKEEEAAAKEILNIIDEGKEEKTMNNTSKLKIKRMEIEGENGTYLVEDGKVKLTGDGQVIEFKNKDELEKYRKEEMERFERRIAEFREVFGMVK